MIKVNQVEISQACVEIAENIKNNAPQDQQENLLKSLNDMKAKIINYTSHLNKKLSSEIVMDMIVSVKLGEIEKQLAKAIEITLNKGGF